MVASIFLQIEEADTLPEKTLSLSLLATYLWRGFTQLRAHGVRLLYWRFHYRYRILDAVPIHCPPDASLEIHIQVCPRDWLNSFWTLYSFSCYSEEPFRLVILHDGWLDTPQGNYPTRCITSKFPGVVLYTRDTLQQQVNSVLAPAAPTLVRLWGSGLFPTLSKVIDSYLLRRNKYVIHLDPDVLFFQSPTELLHPIAQLQHAVAMWNVPRAPPDRHRSGVLGTYCVADEDILRATGLLLPMPFGTGCGVIDMDRYAWSVVEALFASVTIPPRLRFMADQTIFGIFAALYTYMPLCPDRYAILPVHSLGGVVARHYYSKTRDLMYVEGLPFLCSKPEFSDHCWPRGTPANRP